MIVERFNIRPRNKDEEVLGRKEWSRYGEGLSFLTGTLLPHPEVGDPKTRLRPLVGVSVRLFSSSILTTLNGSEGVLLG